MKENNGTDIRRMNPASRKPLFASSDIREPMLSSIAERLRAYYAGELCEPMPPRLQALMRQLLEAEPQSPGPAKER